MAAYAAVLSLMHTIKQIQQHPCPPFSLDQQHLHSLTLNLTFLQKFLEDYCEEEDELESCIADAAYAAEDVIESHIVFQIHGENFSCVDLYQVLEGVIQDMDLIKKEVMKIIKEKILEAEDHLMSTNSSVSIGLVRPVSRMQNNIMVDFGDILNDIMYKLTRQEYSLEIVPIVGMGGTGKTMLARNIYAHQIVVQHFDILTWVTISQEYSGRKILLQVLSEENNGVEMSQDHKLGEKVYKKLWGRKYLVVMDDIWSIEAWDKVKRYFPNNNNGSRIMITTRLSNLAFQLSGSHNFRMKFLNDDKSWDLLSKIVFGKEGCPVDLENIGKEIARNCRGLPLSIVVTGGVLTKSKMTRKHWEYTLENLSSLINLDDNKHCLQILRMSYKELPIHLKPCFLYMGVFPEDYNIYVSDLIKLWIAEGILKPMKNKTLEGVAKEHIKELIERNLILPHLLSWNGNAKSCTIHDLLRDLCVREAKQQRFIRILRRQDLGIPQDINTEHRICIHDNTGNEISPQLIHAMESASLARSLVVFGGGYFRPPPSSTCRLLRVHSYFEYNSFLRGNGDAKALFQLANLRYLSLGFANEANMFPTSWNLLWNLQTLNVDCFPPSLIAPSEFWKMFHLRNVRIYNLELPDPPSGTDDDFVLENLQSLARVLNFKCSEEVVRRIPNIKKLVLYYEGLGSLINLNNLARLRNLKSLHLDLRYHGASYISNSGILLYNLALPHSLKKLSLSNTGFLWADLTRKIGSLPLLEVLKLEGHSCIGTKWETVDGQFCCLKFLEIFCCDLKCWTTDETHFPRLEHLVLRSMELEKIPLNIGDIPTLQSIKLTDCSESTMASAQRIKEEQLSYGNENLQLLIEYYYKKK